MLLQGRGPNLHSTLSFPVSKTTKELLLEWDKEGERSAVSVAKDLRMPQFAMKRITTNKCNSQYHMGELKGSNQSSSSSESSLDANNNTIRGNL